LSCQVSTPSSHRRVFALFTWRPNGPDLDQSDGVGCVRSSSCICSRSFFSLPLLHHHCNPSSGALVDSLSGVSSSEYPHLFASINDTWVRRACHGAQRCPLQWWLRTINRVVGIASATTPDQSMRCGCYTHRLLLFLPPPRTAIQFSHRRRVRIPVMLCQRVSPACLVLSLVEW
jgi:hypothetical protein